MAAGLGEWLAEPDLHAGQRGTELGMLGPTVPYSGPSWERWSEEAGKRCFTCALALPSTCLGAGPCLISIFKIDANL